MSLKMTWTCKEHIERLYLDKEGPEEVYVDIGLLPQHQIDGIRFLYGQFKKKKPGVILNNPEGYGKTLQVTLFLEAVHKLLDNPILILCENDSAVDNWMHHLKTKTHYNEGHIVLDSSNVYVKKSVFLVKGKQLTPPYIRRDWGVVVVKNDFAPKELMRVQMNAKFKVWMTTIDMRKDLHMFNLIYSWMYSEKKFKVESYLDSIPDSVKPLNRMKMLNAFMDEVVIMRNEFQPMKSKTIQETFNVTPKVSRKNKDATGKKIKRSKKKAEVEPCGTAAPDNKSVNVNTKSSSAVISTNIYEKDDAETLSEYKIRIDNNKRKKVETENRYDTETENKHETDLESFICDKKPVECKENEGINEDNSMEVQTEVLRFTEALKDIVETENETAVKDENNCKDVDESLNNGINISNVDEEFSEVDGKLRNANVACAENESSSVNVEKNEISEKGHNDNVEGNEKENSDVDKSKTEQRDKEISKRNLDQKISEMEEIAVKKFKGSLLDSFF